MSKSTNKDLTAYKQKVFEKVKPEYTRVVECRDKIEAQKLTAEHRKDGSYFTFFICEEGIWRVYIG